MAHRLRVIGFCKLTRTVLFCGLLLSLFTGFRSPAFAEPDSYERFTDRIRELGNNSLIAVTKIGASTHGRAIYAVTITSPGKPESISTDRTRIAVLSGQHGDEPLPAYAMLDLLESFTHGEKDISRQDLQNVIVVFIPVVNPDGFAAGTRLNGAGADLNRDWIKYSQPETSAVTKLLEKFRPHILIDQHEWTRDDPHRPDCIETAGFGHNANQRLARLLTAACIRKSSTNGLTLRPAYYIRQSDPSMAHRHFANSDICSMLVETSPDSPMKNRSMAYKEVVRTIIATLSSTTDPVMLNDVSILVNKRGDAHKWVNELCGKWQVQPDSPAPLACLFALLAVAVIAAIRTMAPRNILRQSSVGYENTAMQASRYAITEIVRSDLPMRTRLGIIQRHRQRPSDRMNNSTSSR
ncbi:MAG: M14 family zinc carboxypeptidase [Armatimonadota bacterium]